MPVLARQQKITLAEMRAAGVRGLLAAVYLPGLRPARRRRAPEFRLGARGPAGCGVGLMVDKGWRRPFEDPIPLPPRPPSVTLTA